VGQNAQREKENTMETVVKFNSYVRKGKLSS